MSKNPGFALSVLLATLGVLAVAVRPARCEQPELSGLADPSRYAVCPLLDEHLDQFGYGPSWLDELYPRETRRGSAAPEIDVAELDAALEAAEELFAPPVEEAPAPPEDDVVEAPADAAEVDAQVEYRSHHDPLYDAEVYGPAADNPFEHVRLPAATLPEAPHEAVGEAAAVEGGIDAWDLYGYDPFFYDEPTEPAGETVVAEPAGGDHPDPSLVTTELDFECWPEPRPVYFGPAFGPAPGFEPDAHVVAAAPAPAEERVELFRAEDRQLQRLILLELADRLGAAGRWLQSASHGLERIAQGEVEGPTLR